MTHYSQSNILKIQQFKKKHCKSPENSQQTRNPPSPQNHLWTLLVTKWERMAPSHTSITETLQLNSPDVVPYPCLAGCASNTHSKAEHIERILHFSAGKGSSVPMCMLRPSIDRLLWLIGKYSFYEPRHYHYCTIVLQSCRKNAVFLLKEQDFTLGPTEEEALQEKKKKTHNQKPHRNKKP